MSSQALDPECRLRAIVVALLPLRGPTERQSVELLSRPVRVVVLEQRRGARQRRAEPGRQSSKISASSAGKSLENLTPTTSPPHYDFS